MFDLILTAWSPLFVGNGHSYTKKEYMHDIRSGKVSFFDAQKFFSFLVERDLVEKYTQFMLSGQPSLWEFLTRDCRIPDTDLKPLTRYQVAVGDTLELREIHAFQRDAYGRAYVPGSSVKGALRTAWLLNAVLDDTTAEHTLPSGRKAAFPEEDYVNLLRLSQKRRSDAVNSIFRGIQISDSQPIPDKQMMLAGKFDAFTNGGFSLNSNRGIPLRRECVAPNTRIRFRLTLDQSILKGRITKETLEHAIQRYDAYYQQTYGRKFTPPTGSVSLPRQPYLILGGGAGFFSKSLAYPYLGEERGLHWTADLMTQMFRGHKHERDAENGISPHTMKYARFNGRFYPYGYCGVSIV